MRPSLPLCVLQAPPAQLSGVLGGSCCSVPWAAPVPALGGLTGVYWKIHAGFEVRSSGLSCVFPLAQARTLNCRFCHLGSGVWLVSPLFLCALCNPHQGLGLSLPRAHTVPPPPSHCPLPAAGWGQNQELGVAAAPPRSFSRGYLCCRRAAPCSHPSLTLFACLKSCFPSCPGSSPGGRCPPGFCSG